MRRKIKQVVIDDAGMAKQAVQGFVRDHGPLFGKAANIVAPSPEYNSSYLLQFEDGSIHDIHDQWFYRSIEYI